MKTRNPIIPILAAAIIIFLSACSKTSIENNDTGKLIIKVTDNPFSIDLVESAMVTITKIELRKVSDQEGNPFMILSEDTLTFDLFKLRNGITKELLNLDIPEGKYDLIRLTVDQANLKIKEVTSLFSAKVSNGLKTGIKIFIKPSISIEGGLTSLLILDFDLSKSFVIQGNLNQPSGIVGFIFKPSIRAVNYSSAGRIEGFVTDIAKIKIENASVWVTQDTIIATAFSDTLGHYAFIGMPAGTYSVFSTKEKYDTARYTGVNVIVGNKTVQNITLTKK